MAKKFIRQDYMRYSKIGKGRKKLQKWRKPKGRDSKMREKRRSYPSSPTVGRKSPKAQTGKINNKTPILIKNQKDLNKLSSQNIAIISKRLGARKKLEIIKQAKEKDLPILNLHGAKK
jgi:large subunit ribosomal protein L32e